MSYNVSAGLVVGWEVEFEVSVEQQMKFDEDTGEPYNKVTETDMRIPTIGGKRFPEFECHCDYTGGGEKIQYLKIHQSGSFGEGRKILGVELGGVSATYSNSVSLRSWESIQIPENIISFQHEHGLGKPKIFLYASGG